jgi:hypothetical protein
MAIPRLDLAAGLMGGGCDDLGPTTYEIQPLLWGQIKSEIYPSEVDEIKRVLGNRLIDGNQVCV